MRMQGEATLRILLVGATGRMGQAIAAAVRADEHARLVAQYAQSAREQQDVLALDALEQAPEFDIAIDFSRPAALVRCAALCAQRRSALVSGTTGLDPQAQQALDAAAEAAPVLWASNFSLGAAVLEELAARAARALPGWDCDIVEAHHRHKQDAPSGTALSLGKAVEAARAAAVEGDAPAHGGSAARPVRFASLRCGDLVGEHTVQFAGSGERLELVHRASDRGVFARGALHAARLLARRPAGRWTLGRLLLG